MDGFDLHKPPKERGDAVEGFKQERDMIFELIGS